ncbi:MAG: MOSC domain-containing protein [Acidimicrobiales bacterium]|nr:MOSC domain-containing protein [Acidimicrobiales bacterium]
MTTPETCDQCGFDAAEWNDLDTRRTLGCADALFAVWTDGMSDADRNRRPADDTWSVLEYHDHNRRTLFGLRALCEVALETPGTDIGPDIEPSPPGPARELDADEVASAFAEEARTFASRLAELTDEQMRHHIVIGGNERTVGWASRHAVHDLWHHLVDIAAIRRTLGDAVPAGSGTVARINASGGGVPKTPVDEAAIDRRGVVGDTQAARQHHGRPWQALCLWSTEVIDALADEGHPIDPGSAGENITISGLEWSTLRPGAVLGIGDIRCRISAYAVPCAKNARWFVDGDFNRILHDRHPGWGRLYASVLEGGTVRPGDTVRVIG